jgi:hypothetical protein
MGVVTSSAQLTFAGVDSDLGSEGNVSRSVNDLERSIRAVELCRCGLGFGVGSERETVDECLGEVGRGPTLLP